MLFNSYEFIFIYLPIVFIGYFWLLPKCGGGVIAGSAWLSLASLIFYGYWDIRYVPLLLGSICFNFFIGRFIEKHEDKRKMFLVIGILGNLILLGYYKYTAFFVENANVLTGMAYEIPNIILPLGISFFTFTQTAYLIDAYRGETKGYSFLTYLLFVTIFPHLIAGPIINHLEMIPQFLKKENLIINWKNLSLGITIFVLGLFKKVVIADNFAVYADAVFVNTEGIGFLGAWIGALSYSFQLYFDFSAYSEMAIGLGLLFNIKFPRNFNSPYQAKNIIDFWRRWHMTLGIWVRNYLYIPMGGNRVSFKRKLINLFIVMTAVGFWHGAGWTFIIWGSLHGIYLIINNIYKKMGFSMNSIIAQIMTFVCVVAAWVFFRADSIVSARDILVAMSGLNGIALMAGIPEIWELNKLLLIICELIVAIFVLMLVPNPIELVERRFSPNKIWLALSVVSFIWAVMNLNRYSYFLYFQF